MRAGRLVPFLLLLGGSAGLSAQQGPRSSDVDSVRALIERYFVAQVTGDPAVIRQLFHPDGRLYTFGSDGRLETFSSAQYAGFFAGHPPEGAERRWFELRALDIAGPTATVTIDMRWPPRELTDRMLLAKIDGRWWIVAKTSYRRDVR